LGWAQFAMDHNIKRSFGCGTIRFYGAKGKNFANSSA